MAGVSKYNVLGGEYTATVKAPKNMPPPAYRTDPAPSRPTPTQGCWDLNEVGDHGPVREDQVRAGAKIFCERDKTLSRENSWHTLVHAGQSVGKRASRSPRLVVNVLGDDEYG